MDLGKALIWLFWKKKNNHEFETFLNYRYVSCQKVTSETLQAIKKKSKNPYYDR